MNRRVSVAPMMDYTDRHFRYLLRLLTKRTLLYTEMVVAETILYGDRERHLKFNAEEHPIALQLGGSNPIKLAECAKIAEGFGYDEINLNVGCPSDRVQSGRFGACLMKEPELVAECLVAMREACSIPVTVKTRIGVDDQDSYELLKNFVRTVQQSGTNVFIIHARKAWLKGLSPKQNRDIPPLQYDTVYQVKQDYPELDIVINGGIKTLDDMNQHLEHVDGVMLGRVAYQDTFLLSEIDKVIFADDKSSPTRAEIICEYLDYIRYELKKGTKLTNMTRHLLGLFKGQPGARHWRQKLSCFKFESLAHTLLMLDELENLVLEQELPAKDNSGGS